MTQGARSYGRIQLTPRPFLTIAEQSHQSEPDRIGERMQDIGELHRLNIRMCRASHGAECTVADMIDVRRTSIIDSLEHHHPNPNHPRSALNTPNITTANPNASGFSTPHPQPTIEKNSTTKIDKFPPVER